MNKDSFSSKWHQLKGKVKQKWGKIKDEDLTKMSGKFEELSGKLQERYGWAKEKADQEINDWCSSCDKECKCENHDKKSCGCGCHDKRGCNCSGCKAKNVCNCCCDKKKAS